MKEAVVLVSTNSTGTGAQLIETALHRGLAAILLSPDPPQHTWACQLGVEIVHADTSDTTAVLAACRRIGRQRKVVAVTTTADPCTSLAAYVALELGLPSPDPHALTVASSKKCQREMFDRLGIRSPRWKVIADAEDAAATVTALNGAAVVKPIGGSGSVGARWVEGADAATRHARKLANGELTGRRETALLVEEYVSGPQFSVELFAGEPVGVTQNIIGPLPCFVEIGHDFPAPLTARCREELADLATSAVRALGVCWGAAHVELRIGPRGPVVIEVNARLAGGMIPELIRMALGVDLVAATLGIALGEAPMLAPTRHHAASLRSVLAPQQGRLASLTAPAKLPPAVRWLPVRRPGDLVGGFGDFRDRVGYVIAHAATLEESAPQAERWALEVRVAFAARANGSAP